MKKTLILLAFFPVLSFAEMNHSMHMNTQMQTSEQYQKDYDSINMKMHKDMTINYSGDPDKDFVEGMIAHHQGAVDMAKVQLKYGKDEEMKKLAESIIKDQEIEIKKMKNWLNKTK